MSIATAAALLAFAAPSAFANFGISDFAAKVMKDATHVQTQAGSTPDVGITEFTLNSDLAAILDPVSDIRVDLPPGLISNPQATPTKCAALSDPCDPKTQVGTVDITIAGALPATNVPVYNMVPPAGKVSDFAFDGAILGLGETHIIGGVRDTSDYGLFFTIHNASGLPITHSKLTFFGDPHAHGTGAPSAPFIRLPTVCAGPQTTTLTVVSTSGAKDQRSDITKDDHGDPIGATGCDQVPFAPGVSVTPDTTRRDTPVGTTVGVHVPWEPDPTKLASSHVKDTAIVLPPGMTINPAAATGLQACTDDQFGQGTHNAIACPDASKVGTASIATPVLGAPLTGEVYLGQPLPDDAYRLFVAVKGSGLDVRLKGNVTPDPNTGQLTTTFADTPQVPFEDFTLNLNGGPNATLANPLACGDATTTSSITPYSGNAAAGPTSSFTVDSDGAGGACNGTPFNLGFSAGSANMAAGAFSPFTLNITRDDGNQFLSGLTVRQPAGLLGVIQSVPLCDEALAVAGACPEESRVGTSTVSSGAGPAPFSLSGPVYLAGPSGGGQFSLVIAIRALAGPFDLGTVVVRAPIKVDPADSHLTIETPSLPTILQGIPLRLRTVQVAIDRPNFLFNPTNCDQLAVGATLTSTDGATQEVSSPFQATGCDALPYAPTMTATSHAATRGQPAGLTVNLSQQPGEANTKSVSVKLPSQLGARLSTINMACPQATFQADPKSCGAGSKVGTVSAATPLLAQPLTGTVYLAAHEAGKLPTLEAVLEGSGITVNLSGTLNLGNGIQSTFATVPDVPITSFRLSLPASPSNSALAAGADLCAVPLKFSASILGQNGKKVDLVNSPVDVAGCIFKVTGAKVVKRKATITVRLPAPGRVKLFGPGLKTVTRNFAAAGTYKVKMSLSKKGVRSLKKKLKAKKKSKRKLVLKMKANYTPKAGSIAGGAKVPSGSGSKKLTFKK
ncbi:MAG TPA: hypothetical protein VH247_13760 [Thermoleophilaceae bacterium]|nr:hypothetical protein [Thermoleophilaceae bacterium]